VLLEFTVPPTIDSINLEMRPKVIRGKSITLNCPVQGVPFPNITWLKDGNILEDSERIRYLLSGRQLEISLAEESDASSYTCLAVNIAGKVKKDFILEVLGEFKYPADYTEKLSFIGDFNDVFVGFQQASWTLSEN
jgi:hypothetical protein